MEEGKQKEVIYVTSKYKGLEIVHTPMGMKDTQGNKVPSIRCHFIPTTYGYAFTTANAKIIAWLDKHELMQKGVIQHFDPKNIIPVKSIEVSKGVNSVPAIPETPEAPKDSTKKAHVVKIKK